MQALSAAPVRLQRASGPPCQDPCLHTVGQVIVGRGSDAAVRLENDQVSRHHARLAWDGQRASLTDLRSSGGTLLNGARLEPDEPAELRDRDLIGLGPWTFVVRLAGAPAESHQ
ncbi:MAG: FHA domain-containing protein, partial [Planctomycetes bacterium]|nr:FHA domain-containing protein [Planctomycetota bacterium]